MKYLQGTSTGVLVAGTGIGGSALNQLATSGFRYLYVDSSENLYIADSNNQRIVRWANGASTGVIVAGNGTFGTSLSQLTTPYGIWVDSSASIYVAEYGSHRVTKWDSGATSGTLIAGVTGSAGRNSQSNFEILYLFRLYIDITVDKLYGPHGLYFDETNQNLYISNYYSAATVFKWPIGSSVGTIIAGTAGSAGSTSTELNGPMGITLDSWKNLYVADRYNSRVQLFCNDVTTGITIATGLATPCDVKLDSQMNLYVVENTGYRVSKFSKL